MLRRMIVPGLFGVVGVAILIGLGVWQLQRLDWKTAILARINARLGDAPVALPAHPNEARDEYLAVAVDGTLLPGELDVLTSQTDRGPGYRVIQRLDVAGRIILVDRGFINQSRKTAKRPVFSGRFVGNLLWPDEVDKTFTPDPDIKANIWFARDLPQMAKAMGAEPVLLVLRRSDNADRSVTPWPVNSSGIRNEHLQYAITWFSLALSWFGMTVYLLWRIRQKLD